MSLKNKGVMVILSSPSGAGKTTLVKLLSEENKYKIISLKKEGKLVNIKFKIQ